MATTNVNSVFPPIVNSSTSAFITNVTQLGVSFTIPLVTNYNNVKHIAIRVVQQSNNKTVVNTDKYYDGIIYKAKPTSSVNGVYTVYIDTSDIKVNGNPGWTANMYYKIQIRFGYNELYSFAGIENDIDEQRLQFFKWKKAQTSISGFSEWSNVIITKAINKPIVDILNNQDAKFLYASSIMRNSDNVEHTRFPKFQGGYYNDSEEPLDKYRFRLYEGRFNEEDYDYYVEPYLSTDWIQFNGTGNEEYSALVEHTFNQPLDFLGAVYYTVIFDTISKNEYHCSSKGYTFTVTEGILNPLSHLTLIIKDNSHSGYYAKRFHAPTSNVFYAYKKLVGLPLDSTYLYSEEDNIFYTVQPYANTYNVELNYDKEYEISKFSTNTEIDIKDYEDNKVDLHGILDYKTVYIDENGEKIKSSIKDYVFFRYGQDYTCDTEIRYKKVYDVDGNPLIDDKGEEVKKVWYCVTGINLKEPITGICGGSLYLTLTDNKRILTLEERIATVSEYEQQLRCDENGVLEIYLKNNTRYVETEKFDDVTGFSHYEQAPRYQSLDGIYYLIRSDERSNYSIWEDIAKFDLYDDNRYDDRLTLLYEDFTIESGIRYKYALQRESLQGFRSAPKYEFNELEISPAHCSNFQYAYIYANGVQVRLDLDVKIQQFKHTRLFQKQDSLNSKYPVILRNGIANYGEFSLGAKITLHSDADGSFFMRNDEIDNMNGNRNGGYYYNHDLVISADKYLDVASRRKYWRELGYRGLDLDLLTKDEYEAKDLEVIDGFDIEKGGTVTDIQAYASITSTVESKDYSKFNTDHTNDNIFMERIYRKYVEEFLNDGGYKLYKSPTEGNMIVTLTNVTLIPNQQLGRLISDFSSTVYEVAENTCANIKLYDINPLDVITNNMYLAVGDSEGRYRTVIGQVRGSFDGKYTKCLKITPEVYKKLYDLGLKPYNYFSLARHRLDDDVESEQYDKDEIGAFYYAYEKLPYNIVAAIYKEIKTEEEEAAQKIRNQKQKELEEQLATLEKQYENILIMLDIETESQLKEAQEYWNEKIEEEYQTELEDLTAKFLKPPDAEITDPKPIITAQQITEELIAAKKAYNTKISALDINASDYKEKIQIIEQEYKEKYDNLLLNLDYPETYDKNYNSLNQFYDDKKNTVNNELTEMYEGYKTEEANRYTRYYKKTKKSLEEELSKIDTLDISNEFETLNQFSMEINPYWNKQSDNIYDWIRLQEEVEVSDERVYKLNNVSMIWVELYPKHNLEQELAYLKSITYDEEVDKLRKQLAIARYELILKQYDVSQSNPITLVINNEEIVMFPGRIYHLDNTKIDSIYLKYTRPVLINYVAEVEETDYLPKITLAKQELTNIGQIGGVFTDNEFILNNYQHMDDNLKSLIVSENHNYSLYKSLDILSIIKEKVKTTVYGMSSETGVLSFNVLTDAINKFLDADNLLNLSYEEQVYEAKKILNTYKPLLNMEKNSWTDVWLDQNGYYIIYSFDGLEYLSIEADEGTELNFYGAKTYEDGILKEDETSKTLAKVGPTNKYVLKIEKTDPYNEIKYIRNCSFTKPSYALIDYHAIVSLEIKGNPKGG